MSIQHRILVVAADPEATSQDLLQQEASVISESMGDAKGNAPIVESVRTVNQVKLGQTIGQFHPSIVHLTGHGSPRGRVIFEDSRGWLRNITGATLAKTVFQQTSRPQCLILSSCRVSKDLPSLRFVADNVICVSNRSDGVDIAPLVAKAFYRGIGDGLGFVEAFVKVKLQLAESEFQKTAQAEYIRGEEPPQDVLQTLRGEEFRGVRQQEAIYLPATAEDMSASLKDAPEKVAASPSPKDDGIPRLYRVWFGTNREPIDTRDLKIGFGGERSHHVRYGYCDVSIPKYHVIGSIGSPWWKRFPQFWRDNRLAVHELVPLSHDGYWTSIRALFDSLSESDRVLLMFVHGYNVNFEQAIIRAAQFGFDLGIRGATGLFSWPSKGRVAGYAADIAAIEASEHVLGDFLSDMANRSGALTVHLIVHSMGNRGLIRAVTSAVNRISKTLEIPLNQIVLAAPDVDVDLFKQLAAAYAALSKRTTMYVSGKDKALLSSGIIHDYPRAGYAPPITVVSGIDTVEVSNIDLSLLGHGYIAEAQRVLQDIKTLMEANLQPDRRFGLEACQTIDREPYWRMKR